MLRSGHCSSNWTYDLSKSKNCLQTNQLKIGVIMTTTVITNQLTIIYSGIKSPNGGMFTDILEATFSNEVSEMEWIEEKIRQINLYPENWGACYSFKRVGADT